MVYLPLPAGAITGVAVIPPGQSMSCLAFGGSEYALLKCFFQSIFPDEASMPKMLSDTPVAIAISFGPLLVLTFSTRSVGRSACMRRDSLGSCTFHSSFIPFTFVGVRIRSFFCQFVRWGSLPSVSQSAPQIAAQQAMDAIT